MIREKKMNKKKALFFILPFAVLIVYDFLSELIIELVQGLLDLLHVPIDLWSASPSFLDAFLATILSVLLYLYYRTLFPKKKAEVNLPLWKGVVFAIILGFGAGGLSTIWLNFIDFLAAHIPALGAQAEAFSNLYNDMDSDPYIWTFLAIVVVGPLVEEILFRGIIFRSFEEVTEIPWFPALVSGVMFGIWHGSFIQAVYTAAMGIILGYFIKKCRSLFFVFLAHAVNNISGTLPPALDTDFNNGVITLLSYVCIIPMFLILFYLYKKGKENKKIPQQEAVV